MSTPNETSLSAANVVPEGYITSSVVPTREQRDKRVAIARDILAQLARKDNPLTAMSGSYIKGDFSGFETTKDMQKCVELVQKHCHVCQLGAALLSKARLFNEVEVEDWWGLPWERDSVVDGLDDIFDRSTTAAMEAAFEGVPYEQCSSRYIGSAKRCLRHVDDDSARMKVIVQNLIDNDGLLVVPISEEDD